MARLFACVGNRAELMSQVLAQHRALLTVPRAALPGAEGAPAGPGPGALGWGVGFYQTGEVLLRRRPVDERGAIDLVEAAGDVRSGAVLGHVRHATVGSLRTENTHPFRYRNWLFAHVGTVRGFGALRERLLAAIPEFLRRNVRGETDSEVLFYLALSFLHDAGRLADSGVDPAHVRDALRATLRLTDRLAAEVGEPPNEGALVLMNGEHAVALHRSGVMGTRVLAPFEPPEPPSSRRQRVSTEGSHFTLLVAGSEPLAPGFSEVPLGSLVTLRPDAPPRVEPA